MEGHTLADGLADFPERVPRDLSRDGRGRRAVRPPRCRARAPRRLHREPRGAAQQKVTDAMLYPVVLSVVCLGIVGLLLVYVVPEGRRACSRPAKRELPLAHADADRGVSDFLRDWWYLLLAGRRSSLAWSASVAGCANPRRPAPLSRASSCACRSSAGSSAASTPRASPARLSILTASAVPVLEALRIAGEVVTNLPMRDAVAGRRRARARRRADRPLAGRRASCSRR